jgi:hypothetical protein
VPDEFRWIALTANINRALGSSYRIEEVQAMPSDELTLLGLWLGANF